jgi:hypothetical protein
MAVRDLIIRIGGDSADLQRALDVGGKALKGFGIAGAAAAAAVTAVAVATAAVVAAIVSDTLRLAKIADDLGDAASKVGATAEEYQKVQGIFELMGTSGEGAAKVLQKLDVNLDAARKGAGPAYEALQKLGLKVDDLERLTADEKIAVLSEAMSGLGTRSEIAGTAMDLLGKGGLDLVPAMQAGGDAIREAADEIKQAGVLTDDFAAKSGLLMDQLLKLDKTSKSARATFEEQLLPAITGTAKGIQDLLADARDTGELMRLGVALNSFYLESVVPAIAVAMATVENFFRLIATAGPLVDFLMTLKDIYDTLTSPVDLFFGLPDLEKNLDDLRGSLGEFGADLRGLGDGFDRALDRAEQFIVSVRTAAAEVAKAGKGPDKPPPPPPPPPPPKPTPTPAAPGATSAASPAAADPLTMVGSQASDPFDNEWLASIEGAHDELSKLAADAGAAREAAREAALDTVGSIGSVFGSVAEGAQLALDTAMAKYEEYAAEIESLDEQIANSEDANEKKRLKAKRDALKKKADAEKKSAKDAFKINKIAALMQAGVSTALAIVNAAATVPFVPAGIVAMIAAGAAGAVQIGIIAAQQGPQFHSGGVIGRGLAAQNADLARGVNINALPGEGVVTRRGMDALERLNQGGGVSSQGPTYLVYDRRVVATVSDDLRSTRAGTFRIAPRVGQHNPFAAAAY